MKSGAAILLAGALAVAPSVYAQENSHDSGTTTATTDQGVAAAQAPNSDQSTSQSSESSGKDVKIGYMSCHVASGWGDVLSASRRLKCVYSPIKGPAQLYTGKTTKVGVDVGYLSSAVMLWGVVAPTWDVPEGALAGNYGGVSADAAAGYGAGASAIIGGFKHSVQLEPIAIRGEKGLNIAAGVEELSLHYEGPLTRREAQR